MKEDVVKKNLALVAPPRTSPQDPLVLAQQAQAIETLTQGSQPKPKLRLRPGQRLTDAGWTVAREKGLL